MTQSVEIDAARCPGCGHTCCPNKQGWAALECGGDSDAVLACTSASCRGCGWPLAWPLTHAACGDLPRVIPPGEETP